MDKVSVLTPTADRPAALRLAERWMARQTRQPDEWIVADGGLTPAPLTMGQVHIHDPSEPGLTNFGRNILHALDAASGDVLVFWEDDDWYATTHLEDITDRLRTVGAAGHEIQRYFHLPSRSWVQLVNRGSSLCQTGLRAEHAPIMRQAVGAAMSGDSFGVDARFWRSIRRPKPSVPVDLYREGVTVVGMKGLPGCPGLGMGHRPDGPGWTPDPDMAALREWIGDDADTYRELMKTPPAIS